MSNIVRNGMIGISVLIGVSQIAFYIFESSYTVTPFRVAVTVFATLLPIAMAKLMGFMDDRNGQKLDRMSADFLARHQNESK